MKIHCDYTEMCFMKYLITIKRKLMHGNIHQSFYRNIRCERIGWIQLNAGLLYLEAEHQVVKLEQVVQVQLQSDWIHLYRTNKQNSISTRYTTHD